jgi:hypothetical protein
MRPILEIRNAETGEQWLFQYQVIRPFENSWLRLTPVCGNDWFFGLRSRWHRLKVLVFELLATGVVLAMLGYVAVIVVLVLWSMISDSKVMSWLD